jgi:Fic family protein
VDLEQIRRAPIGQLVPITGRDARHGDFAYFAYLPAPLPDDVALESLTWRKVADASSALGKLDRAVAQLPNPKLLIRPALFREALDTSALEGTVGVLRDLLEAQLPGPRYLSAETREINAYVDVAMTAFNAVGRRRLSIGFLSEMQARLFRDSDDQPQDIGRLRQGQVWIGERHRPIQEARFVPPPADDRLHSGVDAWENWIKDEHAHLAPVVSAAMAHYQFETLHPFGDGNGRLGRLVVVLQLLRSGMIQQPAITLSPWLLRHREAYQAHLLAVSCTGNWNSWIQFFCEAVTAQCTALIAGADDLLRWLSDSRRKLDERRYTGTIHKVLAGLIEWPVTTISDTAARYGVTQVAATRLINHLVEVSILTEMTGRSYGRTFGAVEVMRIVDRI